MTAHIVSSNAAYTLPPTQNTAPVFEHCCLFTHDVRRKSKRWHDGYLRFHTFNRRCMVFDIQRNRVGETYPADVQEGDELSLDRGGIIVQVQERKGVTETDLSEVLIKKTVQPNTPQLGKKNTGPSNNGSFPAKSSRPSNVASDTPAANRWNGMADIIQRTPFELRHVDTTSTHDVDTRSHKRRRRDDEHIPLWQLLRTTKASKPKDQTTDDVTVMTPLRTRNSNTRLGARSSRCKSAGKKVMPERQERLNVMEIIDITSTNESDGLSPINQHELRSSPIRTLSRTSHPRAQTRQINEGHAATFNLPGPGRLEEEKRKELTVANSQRAIIVQKEDDGQLNGENTRSKASVSPEVASNEKLHDQIVLQEAPIKVVPRAKAGSMPKDLPSVPEIIDSNPPSPHVSTTNQIKIIEQDEQDDRNEEHIDSPPYKAMNPTKCATKPLRIATRPPRKLLLCQDTETTKKPARTLFRKPPTNTKNRFLSNAVEPIELADEPFVPVKRARDSGIADQRRNSSLNALKESLLADPSLFDDEFSDIDDKENNLPIPKPQLQKEQRPDEQDRQPNPRQGQRDYRHLDAQLIRKPVESPRDNNKEIPNTTTTNRDPNSNPTLATNINETIVARQDSVLLIPPNSLPPNNTLRRHHSTNSSIPNPPQTKTKTNISPKRTLERAQTIPGNQISTTKPPKNIPTAKTQSNPQDSGPWSREAWDLFGWCPPEKAAVLGWKECARNSAIDGNVNANTNVIDAVSVSG